MKTGGPIRGLIGRWVMRVQAVQGILSLVGIAVTAASTLTTALVQVGYGEYAPWVLAAGLVGSPIFAYAYVELGFFNRKNRENVDRGDNFAGPGAAINARIRARQLGAAVAALENGHDSDEAFDFVESETNEVLAEVRNGVDLEEAYQQ